MSRDELRQPLRKRSLKERLWAKRPGSLLAVSILAGIGFIALSAWAIHTPYPFAGEPIFTAAIPAVEEMKTASTTAPEEEALAEETAPEDEGASIQIEAPIEQDSYQTEASIILSPRRPLKAAPVADLIEITSVGQLPRIGSNNKKPSEVYARTTPMGVIHSGRPKIAILLGGMGLNPKLTQQAIRDLPGDVTFAFAPYGDDLQAQVNKARADGHEVLLQLPMEPVGYPANNPGPKTLLADADQATNLEALHWHMSRFAGYTGITNYMGGRLLSTASALKPVMAEMRKRGLVYLEDASTALTVSQTVAAETRLSERRAQVVIDADPTPQSIAAALELLEGEALSHGFAIGTGSGLKVTVDSVKEWAEQLQSKGILLVPVSAMYKGRLG
jgi:polysaccharide deacetylase 2 family uncharacterized protein YibQ